MQAIINVYAPKELKTKIKKIAKAAGERSSSAWIVKVLSDAVAAAETFDPDVMPSIVNFDNEAHPANGETK